MAKTSPAETQWHARLGPALLQSKTNGSFISLWQLLQRLSFYTVLITIQRYYVTGNHTVVMYSC